MSESDGLAGLASRTGLAFFFPGGTIAETVGRYWISEAGPMSTVFVESQLEEP
jgi:hypothetical protein